MRPRKAKRKKNVFLRILLWGGVVTAVALGGASLYVWSWVRSYVQSDDFRLALAGQLGRVTKSEATLDSLKMTGSSVYISGARLVPRRPVGWKKIEADRIEGSVNWNMLRDGVAKITLVRMDWATLELQSSKGTPKELPLELDQETQAAGAPDWLKPWLPTKTEIDEVRIDKFNLIPPSDGGVRLDEITVVGKPVAGTEQSWDLEGTKGKLTLPAVDEPFQIQTLNARVDAQGLNIKDANAQWLGDSEVTAQGDVPFGEKNAWKFTGTLHKLKLASLISPEWQSRLSGELEGTYKSQPGEFSGSLKIKNGVIQNMPMLDRVADFTRTDRFRRLVLDQASGDIVRRGEHVRIRKLVLQSNGLVRVEGDVDIRGDQIDGDLYVGVLPDSLRWMPGSQKNVFTETRAGSPEGFVWTRVRIGGTLQSPREDLSNRLLAAMGKALILDAPMGVAGKGVELLGGAAGVTQEAAKGTVETGKGVIKGTGEAAGKVIEGGVDIIKGVFGR